MEGGDGDEQARVVIYTSERKLILAGVWVVALRLGALILKRCAGVCERKEEGKRRKLYKRTRTQCPMPQKGGTTKCRLNG